MSKPSCTFIYTKGTHSFGGHCLRARQGSERKRLWRVRSYLLTAGFITTEPRGWISRKGWLVERSRVLLLQANRLGAAKAAEGEICMLFVLLVWETGLLVCACAYGKRVGLD